MRYIDLSEAEIGMILAKPVLDEIGRILIAKEAVLSESFINKLSMLGVGGIYINDELSMDIDIDEPISPALKSAGFAAVRNQDINQCMNVAKQIVQELLKKGFVTMDMKDLRTYDNYTFAHSVSVAILSCTIGFGMRLSEKELEDLVLAGLLHDLGKLGIPDEIINKPGRLTQEEFGLIKAHPQLSYEMIKDRIDISSMTKNAVLCHHENYDGSGYPNGIAADGLTRLASIIHVADVYDALISKRPYKEPYSPYAAIEIIQGGRGTQYDPDIIDSFLASVPLYPKGTTVELDNSIKGIVIDNLGPHNMRPVIRTDVDTVIDLSASENLHYVITNPADQDYFRIKEDEEMRKTMVQSLVRHKVMILDSFDDTFNNLQSKMSYLYDFIHVATDGLAEGYIRRDGVPDLLIVDLDHRDLRNFDDLFNKFRKMSKIVPIIVVGSFRDLETITMLKRLGIQNYVLKPYKIIYLQSEIQRAIDAGITR